MLLCDSTSAQTADVFDRYKDRIVQVRILENTSGAKASIGSGFFVSPDGHIVTNYHVVSALIQKPGSYRAEVVLYNDDVLPLELLNIDVIHDLAVVKIDVSEHDYFDLGSVSLKKGQRVFSLGDPHDLGFTIVEGTFNGLIKESLYEKIHFTGSINPGMSGGPSIDKQGRLVGVNVSTAGNQLSFLVPAKFVQPLVADAIAHKPNGPVNFSKIIRDQLIENQELYVNRMLASPGKDVVLGQYRLPGRPVQGIKCWGDIEETKETPYTFVSHKCSSQDVIYISDVHSSGAIVFQHDLFSTSSLNPFQFYSLYEAQFGRGYRGLSGGEEEVTNFQCTTEFVEVNAITLKVAYCMRAFKKLAGLYDLVLRAATLENNQSGVQSTLVASGLSFKNSQRFARAFLDRISWNK